MVGRAAFGERRQSREGHTGRFATRGAGVSARSRFGFVTLSLAFSPCPNDTFVFHALTHGLVPGAPEFDVTFADVDVTNTAALEGRFDLVKVSYAALPW